MYARPMESDAFEESRTVMTGFYLWNNAGIGLRCFASGIFLGIGSLFTLAFNAIFLGAIFGHMTRTSSSSNFLTFVTAHGPFELTAVVLSVDGPSLRRACQSRGPMVKISIFQGKTPCKAAPPPFERPCGSRSEPARKTGISLSGLGLAESNDAQSPDGLHQMIKTSRKPVHQRHEPPMHESRDSHTARRRQRGPAEIPPPDR